MGEIGRRKRGSTLRRAGLVGTAFLLALSLATVAVAQNSRTTTILGTAHDFSFGATAPGFQVPDGDNHCEVCHGPPVIAVPPIPYPEWKHNSSPSTDYDTADWLFAIGDGLDGDGVTTLDIFPLGTPGSPGTGPDYNGDGIADGDGVADDTMVAGGIVEDCMGCHEGDIAVNDYDGTAQTSFTDIYDAGDGSNVVEAGDTGTTDDDGYFIPADDAFGTDLSVHHPVDIVYDDELALAQGALEDPALSVNPQGGGSIADTLLDYAGKLNCESCHEQHNDRRFDLIGFDPTDDPEMGYGNTDISRSDLHKFLIFDRLCFNCHTHEQPWDHKQHHIPGRTDPYGDKRGSDMNCALCHKITPGDPGGSYLPACTDCHFRGIVRNEGPPGDFADFTSGHHGGDRDQPYFDCAMCHADPLTGVLTGNMFGTIEAKSCFQCHPDLWTDENDLPPDSVSVAETVLVDPDGDPLTNPTVYGTVGESLAFTAVVAGNEDGEILAYQWSFGDGSTPPAPSHDPTITHTFEVYSYRTPYKASVAVTDGVNPPVFYEFDIVIDDAETHTDDTWAVEVTSLPNPPGTVVETFNITFEDQNGSLVGVQEDDGQLSFGIEFVGVIFWMELWMDLNDSAFWGVGDMFFGNVQRGTGGTLPVPGTMEGVVFQPDGTLLEFTGSGGAPASHE